MKKFLQKNARGTLKKGAAGASPERMQSTRNKRLLGNVSSSMHLIETDEFVASWKVADQPALSVKLDRPGEVGEQVGLPCPGTLPYAREGA